MLDFTWGFRPHGSHEQMAQNSVSFCPISLQLLPPYADGRNGNVTALSVLLNNLYDGPVKG